MRVCRSWVRPSWVSAVVFPVPDAQPWRNGYIESFNSRVRDECNINMFWSLTHARVVITDWKHEYNHHRRHSAPGYQTPATYAAACTHR